MRGRERGGLATGTLAEFDHGYAGTIAELGHPTRSAPRAWRDGHERTGEVPAGRFATNPGHAAETGRRAAGRHPGHGRGPAGTTGALGHPKGRGRPSERAGGLAPGRRGHRGPGPGAREGGDSPRGGGAGRRRARGEGRVRRGDGRATRRAGDGTLPYPRHGEMAGDGGGKAEGRESPRAGGPATRGRLADTGAAAKS